jgi:hypothetical protein
MPLLDLATMDLGEMGWGDVDWTSLAQDRKRWRALVNLVLNLRVPWNAGKLSSGLTSSGLSSSAQPQTYFILVGYILLHYVHVYLSIYIPAIATENFLVIFLLVHNMFRPLRAILRWNIITLHIYLEKAIYITTDPLFHNLSLIIYLYKGKWAIYFKMNWL